MNAERLQQETVPSPVKQRKEQGCLQLADNRGGTVTQRRIIDAIQRETEEEEPLQGKFETAQRAEEEEEPLQGKFAAVQRMEDEEDTLQQKPAAVQRKAENQTGMPDAVKQKMEGAFGTDFSSVRVHAESPEAPRVQALAYTQGTDIHFAPGQFKPDTFSGRQLLGHELAHVVQQRSGLVTANKEVGGMPVNDDPSLEQKADQLGTEAAAM